MRKSDKLIQFISSMDEDMNHLKLPGRLSQNLMELHSRLVNGRSSFSHILELVIKSVINISAIDLKLHDKENKLIHLSTDLSNMSKNVYSFSTDTLNTVSEISKAHDGMLQSISSITDNSTEILSETIENEEHLSQIQQLSSRTISQSTEMNTDMKELITIINEVQQVIHSIEGISEQTNLLALNASIEAARAGESGKGFAVVAEEIRTLAEQTKNLTGNISDFVKNIENASEKTANSVNITAQSLEEINTDLTKIVHNNAENKVKIENINEAINTMAATSEEINTSITNVETHIDKLNQEISTLSSHTEVLTTISDEIKTITNPLVTIEKDLDEVASISGDMVHDKFYMIENNIFIDTINNAVKAHKSWVASLSDMVKHDSVFPLQTDPKRCGFGHFYYAIKPSNTEIAIIWKELEAKHKELHRCGQETINYLMDGKSLEAQNSFEKAESLSVILISDFEKIIALTNQLSANGINVFDAA